MEERLTSTEAPKTVIEKLTRQLALRGFFYSQRDGLNENLSNDLKARIPQGVIVNQIEVRGILHKHADAIKDTFHLSQTAEEAFDKLREKSPNPGDKRDIICIEALLLNSLQKMNDFTRQPRLAGLSREQLQNSVQMMTEPLRKPDDLNELLRDAIPDWGNPLTENEKQKRYDDYINHVQKSDAFFVLDNRKRDMPDSFKNLVPEKAEQSMVEFCVEHLGIKPGDLEEYKGKTILVSYLPYGDGHKHQSYEIAYTLAKVLNARVIVFNPMEGLPPREQFAMELLRLGHIALQNNDAEGLAKIIERVSNELPFDKNAYVHAVDSTYVGLLQQIAKAAVPMIPSESNVKEFTKFQEKMNLLFMKLSVVALNEFGARSAACATGAVAAEFGAEAILSTMSLTLSATTDATLRFWLPKEAYKKAIEAFKRNVDLIPDPGYAPDLVADAEGILRETGLHQIASSFTALARPFLTKWPHNIGLSVVANKEVAERVKKIFKYERFANIASFGTMAIPITPEEMAEKWNPKKEYFDFLFASNGNGTNVPEMVYAMKELYKAGWEKTLTETKTHVHLFIRKKESLALLKKELSETGYSFDDIDLIEYEDPEKPLVLDRTKKIHIICAISPAANSKAKLEIQKIVNVEGRSPGEHIITDIIKGILAVGTPGNAINEKANMVWAIAEMVGVPWSYRKKNFWKNWGIKEEAQLKSETFPDLIHELFSGENFEKTRNMVYQGYLTTRNLQNFAVILWLMRSWIDPSILTNRDKRLEYQNVLETWLDRQQELWAKELNTQVMTKAEVRASIGTRLRFE